VVEGEAAIPLPRAPQPGHGIDLALIVRDRPPQQVEPADEQKVDQPLLVAEPVVDPHGGDARLSGDGPNRDPGWSVSKQDGVGSLDEDALQLVAGRSLVATVRRCARHTGTIERRSS